MLGTNEIPPKRGILPLWIFRGSGESNNRFRKAMSEIWGRRSPDKQTDITKPMTIKK